MTSEKFKRKLAAILSADVKGYSRLMGEDEEGTIRTLKVYMEVISSFIKQHRGRVVSTAGDSVLAEFVSVVDAVRCAVEIQEELKDRNKEVPEDRRMEFRIGVNLGDVVEEGDNILGDGVNVAARVQSLADAGGICISGTVYENIKNKLAFGYEYVGEQAVKNIKEPVRVYRVLMEPGLTKAKKGLRREAKGKRAVGLGILAVLVVVALVVLWQFYLRPSAPPVEVASKEKMAFPFPDKPSIAVLPFVNMSEDPKQEFFSDGMTEEIITALSKSSKLFVIARNSTFVYKGKAVKVKQVSEELGVRYVLEGSIRKTGDKVRITAQLIDALTGHHLWAERYDRDLKDIFALQDEITMKIISALQVQLTVGETAHMVEKGTQNLEAYLKGLQAKEEFLHMNKQGFTMAKQLAKEAIALDPKYAFPYTVIAECHMLEAWWGISDSPQESIKLGLEAAQRASVLNDSDPATHAAFNILYMFQRQYDKAIASAERAFELAPGEARTHWVLGRSLAMACRFREAIQYTEQAIRLDPFPHNTYFVTLGTCYRFVGRYEEAVSALKKAIQLAPDNFMAHINLTSTYSMMGREKEARAEAEEVLRINPKFSLDYFAKTLSYKDQAQNDKIINALRKAGLK